ncbi:PH domain-containing protein [Sphingomonas sp. CJ99]
MNEAPRRTHPATILIRALRDLPQTLLALPALYAALSKGGAFALLLLPVAMLAVIGFFAWLKWQAFTYRIGEDELVIADGVLNKSRRSIPLERIQDVSTEQKPLARLFGLALVRIETAGGDKNEGLLDSVSMAEADRLRALLRRGGGGVQSMAAADDAAPVAATPVFAMSMRRVLTLGLFRFSLVWIAVALGGLQFLDNFIDFEQVNYREVIRQGGEQVRDSISPLLIALLALLAAAIGVISGLVRTLFKEHGFTLTAADGRFRRVRGLTTRTEVVIANARIQLALIRHGRIARLFGWQSLAVQMLGGSDDPGGLQDLAPLARAEETTRILDVAGLPPWGDPVLVPVAFAHSIRAMVGYSTLPLIGFVGLMVVQPWLWPLGVLLVGPVWLGWLQRRHHRYALDAGTLRITRGVLRRRAWIVPAAHVQTVTLSRGWLARRLGVATLVCDTAGASLASAVVVRDLPLADATTLMMALRSAIDPGSTVGRDPGLRLG